MLRSNMMKIDFDSMTSSQSTMTMIGPNGQETTISQTSEKNVEGQQRPEKEVEEYKVEEYKPFEVEQVYEDTNEKSHTYSKLNGELDSEQREAATAAKKALNMSEFDKLLNDFSTLDELDPNQDSIFDESGCTENNGDDDIGMFITHI